MVLALDNDPIAQIFISESKRLRIKTILVQEALIRPYEYTMRKFYLSYYLLKCLRSIGIYLVYTKYGTEGCNKILVGGKIAADIMKKRGVPKEKITIVGHPKYDALIEKITCLENKKNKRKTYLFAASTTVIHDDINIQFLKKLIESTTKLGVHLIIKLHPRGPQEPEDIYEILNIKENPDLEIIKEGDDTFEILKRSDVLITVSSTIVLEALMMDKECIIATYLAGEFRLEYEKYDAVYSIQNEDEIYHKIKNTVSTKKSYANKQQLLEDELYLIDGQAGLRAAIIIESMNLVIKNKKN